MRKQNPLPLTNEAEARAAADRLGATALTSIPHLWRQRFGRELGSHREVIAWLCAELGYQKTEAEQLTLEQVARLLAPHDAPLPEVDQIILDCMPPGQPISGATIARLTRRKAGEVRKRLMKLMPLRTRGLVVQPQGANGYIRVDGEQSGTKLEQS